MKSISRKKLNHDKTLDEVDLVHFDHVTFVCAMAPDAKKVCLAGDFNKWDPKATPMIRTNGLFRKTVKLSPGEHQYKFVIDGVWQSDPAALSEIVNAFGSLNSVLWV